jgi:hypothetical protein
MPKKMTSKIPLRHKIAHLLGTNMISECFKYDCGGCKDAKEKYENKPK